MMVDKSGDILSLNDLFSFVRLLNDFRDVERVVNVEGSDRFENDVEHSYSLSMLAWYLIKANNLPLDFTLVTQYALIHDLVEVYAGDTFAYGSDEVLSSKHDREQAALDRLKSEFPKFSELTDLIDRYGERVDDEARFVYALDKLHPMLQVFLDGGRTWRDEKITLKMILDEKTPKVIVDPTVKHYFDELVSLFKEHSDYFSKE